MRHRLPAGKEMVVLRILRDARAEMYGLELVKGSDGKLGQASIYVTLARMEAKGYIRSHTPPGDDHPGLPRPRYKITALGEKAFAAAAAAERIFGAEPGRA